MDDLDGGNTGSHHTNTRDHTNTNTNTREYGQ